MSLKTVSNSRIRLYEIINGAHCSTSSSAGQWSSSSSNTSSKHCVSAGPLLKWMDIAACMSAERHADGSAVTMSMDDMYFHSPIEIGTTLEIVAQVNCAFNTSCEVEVTVTSQKATNPGTHVIHCMGFFTFVSLDEKGKKKKLATVIPETDAERDNCILAKERRKIRFTRMERVEALTKQQTKKDITKDDEELQKEEEAPADGKNDSSAKFGLGKVVNNVVNKTREGTQNVATVIAKPIAKPVSKVKARARIGRVVRAFKSNENNKKRSLSSSNTPKEESSKTPSASSSSSHSSSPVVTPPPTPQPAAVTMNESSLCNTHIVLPSDANHMGNTFGGQIMSWMEETARICALRHVRAGYHNPTFTVAGSATSSSSFIDLLQDVYLSTTWVDAMVFRGKSNVGDRITCKAQCNRTFGCSVEVGLRVEAQFPGGEVRHINTGYINVMCLRNSTKEVSMCASKILIGLFSHKCSQKCSFTFHLFSKYIYKYQKEIQMPELTPETPDQKQQYSQAVGRCRFRTERILLHNISAAATTTTDNVSSSACWKWSDDMSKEISLGNIASLLSAINTIDLVQSTWINMPITPPSLLNQIPSLNCILNEGAWGNDVKTLIVSAEVNASAAAMFDFIMDVSKRTMYDPVLEEARVVRSLDENNDIIQYVYKGLVGEGGEKKKKSDYSLLRTWGKHDSRYIISSRSILHPSLPEDDDFIREEISPSGFILSPILDENTPVKEEEVVSNKTHLQYVIIVTPRVKQIAGGNPVQLVVGAVAKLIGHCETL
mmetsp:Transcript_55775/g.83071  ORF Transcript_55775/g.83071 Transcript_55775/m.83071 type:complete len:775 (-) Transcript_55775:311-2635(-)